ncbi:MAG TPA: serine--tRNA ligase [Xanthobacteraceae bacterium]|nr:serine--tRNA ligase [Xanthobacteraceae bacterium]
MHDIRFIRDNPQAFDRALARRGLEPQAQRLIELDQTRRIAIQTLEEAQARRNEASKLIGAAKKSNEEETAQALMTEVAELKDSIPKLETEEKAASKALDDALAEIPNLPADDVPDGKDANDNVEHHRFGAKREYAFKPKQHFDLGEALGEMDFETAAKLSGARFVVLKKGLARLERALGQFMLDVHTSEPHNYTEIAPPLLVSSSAMRGTAQLPKFEDDQYYSTSLRPRVPTSGALDNLTDAGRQFTNIAGQNFSTENDILNAIDRLPVTKLRKASWGDIKDFVRRTVETGRGLKTDLEIIVDAMKEHYNTVLAERLWLIPTAEVPLTNLVRESIVDEEKLPMRLTACTPCFRAEAGAAGKDTRGMIRQHQFTKVELVSITTPEQSKDEHERMLSCAEEILRRLDLHYRVMTLCAGDMGFAAQKTYDIEVWLPGQGMYREISSCSSCGEFQARRMNARYRSKEGRQVRPVHTLNGSGVAVGRALIAVMETYQQENGAIAVPDALAPYMGGIKSIEKQ